MEEREETGGAEEGESGERESLPSASLALFTNFIYFNKSRVKLLGWAVAVMALTPSLCTYLYFTRQIIVITDVGR